MTLIAFTCGHCFKERCDRATMVVLVSEELGRGPHGRPLVAVTTACPHGAWGWTWQSPSEPISATDQALLIGQAGQDHWRQFGCPCFADRARVRIGLPDGWRDGVRTVHAPLVPIQ